MATNTRESGYKPRIREASSMVWFFFSDMKEITTITRRIEQVSAINSQLRFCNQTSSMKIPRTKVLFITHAPWRADSEIAILHSLDNIRTLGSIY